MEVMNLDVENCRIPEVNITCDPRRFFTCESGECISRYDQCDTVKDCVDGSDEKNCEDPCSANEFKCKNGDCTSDVVICNGIVECLDGSDEENCQHVKPYCDTERFFKCNSGGCIPKSWKCDFKKDCMDGSDEFGCGSCRSYDFRCPSNPHICISGHEICNRHSYSNCREEEENCHTPEMTPICDPNRFFTCKSRQCIYKFSQCDSNKDCADGSDERNCDNIKPFCGVDEFQCPRYGCVPEEKLCNGINDCHDGSDEKGCNITCNPSKFFTCKTGTCIATSLRCDSTEDCEDGSDEINCDKEKKIEEFLNDIMVKKDEKHKFKKIENTELRFEADSFDSYYERIHLTISMDDGSIKRTSYLLENHEDEIGSENTKTDIKKTINGFAQKLVPLLEELAEEVEDLSEQFWVKIFGTQQNFVIKEDIRRYGYYIRLNPRIGANLEESEIIMTTMAKFHAMTAVLNERGKLQMKQRNVFYNNPKRIQLIRELGENFTDSMSIAWGNGWTDAVEWVKDKFSLIPAHFNNMLYSSNSFPISVLNFGKIRNIFFKFNISDVYTSKFPIAAKIDDYYMTPGYPIFDIQNFLATVPNNTVMFKYEDHLVEVYHESFTKYLQMFKYKKEIPSIELFKKEIDNSKLYKLFLSIGQLRHSYKTLREAPGIQMYVEKAEKTLGYNEKLFFGKHYINVMKEIVKRAMAEKPLSN